MQRDAVNYLNVCSYTPKARAVLFAGDAKHPDRDVYARLRERTEVMEFMGLSDGTVLHSTRIRQFKPRNT